MKNKNASSDDNRGKFTRREFIGGAIMIGAGALFARGADVLAAMAPPPQGATATVPVFTINDPSNFKILQVTDIHLQYVVKGVLGNPNRIGDIKSMVDAFKPDLIVNTGDFWASVSGDKNSDTAKWACKEFAKFKTPWAFAWGNHDEAKDYNLVHAMLETAPYLIYNGAADGNYRIEVRAKGADTPVWNLIMLNDSRGGIRQEQTDWFNAEAGRIKKETPAPPPAFLFLHIPLPQYDDVAASGKAVGVKFESVSHEGGSREAFPAFRDSGFVRAMFCGHDHVNDYYGEIGGVRLQYGRGVGGYGEDKVRKGGTLITVDTVKKTFDTKTVFPDGTSVTFDKFITKQEPGKIY